jgi:hypothetical protein
MQLQYLEDENQELQDCLLCHIEFFMSIIQELQSELQAKDKMFTKFHKSEQVEKDKFTIQKRPSSIARS